MDERRGNKSSRKTAGQRTPISWSVRREARKRGADAKWATRVAGRAPSTMPWANLGVTRWRRRPSAAATREETEPHKGLNGGKPALSMTDDGGASFVAAEQVHLSSCNRWTTPTTATTTAAHSTPLAMHRCRPTQDDAQRSARARRQRTLAASGSGPLAAGAHSSSSSADSVQARSRMAPKSRNSATYSTISSRRISIAAASDRDNGQTLIAGGARFSRTVVDHYDDVEDDHGASERPIRASEQRPSWKGRDWRWGQAPGLSRCSPDESRAKQRPNKRQQIINSRRGKGERPAGTSMAMMINRQLVGGSEIRRVAATSRAELESSSAIISESAGSSAAPPLLSAATSQLFHYQVQERTQKMTQHEPGGQTDETRAPARSEPPMRRTGESPRGKHERRRCSLLLKLLLLAVVWRGLGGVWQPFGGLVMQASAARVASVAASATNAGASNSSGPLEMWRSLLESLYSDRGASGAAEFRAQRLSSWPSRRDAALFYLEELARRTEATSTGHSPGAKPWCRTVSLAELLAPGPTRDQVARDELRTGAVWPARLAAFLEGDRRYARLAQLAVDNANLITRLLLMDQRGNQHAQRSVSEAASLEPASANDDNDNINSGSNNSNNSIPSGEPSNDARLFRRALKYRPVAGRTASGTKLDQVESLLRHLVGPRFLNFMLEYKLREFLAGHSPANQRGDTRRGALHSIGIVLFEPGKRRPRQQLHDSGSHSEALAELAAIDENRDDDDDNDDNDDNPIVYSRLARIGANEKQQIDLVDVLELKAREGNAIPFRKSAQTFGQATQSAILKWQRMAGDEQTLDSGLRDRLLKQLSQEQQQQQQEETPDLRAGDGAWFAPVFDCGLANRWQLTYSIPFLSVAAQGRADDDRNAAIRIRGVSYVNLDLAKTGALINQCATNEADNDAEAGGSGAQEDNRQSRIPSFLADTNHCRLVGSSQCVPILEYFGASEIQTNDPANVGGATENPARRSPSYNEAGESPQFRPGAYVCQCPAQSPRLKPMRSSAREQLIGLSATSAQVAEASLATAADADNAGHGHQATRLNGDSAAVFADYNNVATKAGRPFELGDKQIVAEFLLTRQRQRAESQRRGRGSSSANLSTPSVPHRSFVLGAELERLVARQMLTTNSATDDRKLDEPLMFGEACQACERRADSGEPSSVSQPGQGRSNIECAASDAEAPLWDGRAGWPGGGRLIGGWIRTAVLAGQVVCMVLTLALIGIILRIRKSRTIIVSGWLMLETMLVGALLLYASVLVRYFQATSLTCLVEPWLRELGFSTFYGSILIKLYRILTEFQTRKAHRVCLRDKDQIVYLLAIVFIVIGYMSAWTALMVDGFFVRQTEPGAARFPVAVSRPPVVPSSSPFQSADATSDALLAASLDDAAAAAAVAANASSVLGATRGDATGGGDDGRISLVQSGGRVSAPNEADWVDRGAAASRKARAALDNEALQLAPHLTADVALNEDAEQQQRQQRRADMPNRRLANRFVTTSANAAKTTDRRAARRKREVITPAGPSGSVFNDHLEILARGLNSFGELFLGLLETEQKYEPRSDSFVYRVRCRKLTWDYVTESSEIALLLFGLHLVYKLRNAPMEVNKEKLILGLAVLIELITSSLAYLVRHSFWRALTSDHLLVLYAIRCQLTVTLTVVLVFGPKLWEIGRSKPGLLVGALCGRCMLDVLVNAGGCESLLSVSRPGFNAGSGHAGEGQGGQGAGKLGGARATSVRHRCHISCEVHDHHLNDATRLHQAMLSNSALEIGSINLADMDPDEIQAELKRVYTQLELLKTKVMRRDNPHISKRRGGRKPGHRKFSLQAFHARHSTSGVEHGAGQQLHSSISSQPTTSGYDLNNQTSVGAGTQYEAPAELAGVCRQQQQQHSTASSIKRLPAVTELEGESLASGHASGSSSQQEKSRANLHATTKHVRLDDRAVSEHQQLAKIGHGKPFAHIKALTGASTARSATGESGRSLAANRSHAASSNHQPESSKWTPELPSTSSLGFDEEALMNESQSSGEITPQRRSSIIYNHHQS